MKRFRSRLISGGVHRDVGAIYQYFRRFLYEHQLDPLVMAHIQFLTDGNISPLNRACEELLKNVFTCKICDREMIHHIEEHHLVPRCFKGKQTIDIHRICHRKIHSVLTEKELETTYNTVEALREHPEIAKFREWVAGKHPDFVVDFKMSANMKSKKRRK